MNDEIIHDQADRLFRDLLSGAAPSEGQSLADELWRPVQEAGLPLALAPERCGGIGLSLAEAGKLLALAGYHTVPLPLAETMLAVALWAEAAGTVLDGPASLAPANFADRVRVRPGDGGFRLTGTLTSVPWGAQVDHVVVFATGDDGEGHLVLVRAPFEWSARTTNMAGEPRADAELADVVVPEDHVRPAPPSLCPPNLGPPNLGPPDLGPLSLGGGPLPLGAAARAFQMVGAMRRALDLSVTYAGERTQFGRPLAKFQAIQQMLAEAAGHVAAGEAACARAAAATGGPDFPFFAAAAKARVGEAAGKVAEICHQVHGAMGFTREHPLHFATRRLWAWRDEFGNEAQWQEIIGRSVCAAGGAALWPRVNAFS